MEGGADTSDKSGDDLLSVMAGEGPFIPSVVTRGGVPVATDGDLVYLGGGVYAQAAPPERERMQPQRKKPPERHRMLPGRVRPLPPRQAGHVGSSARSASARSSFPPSVGDLSPRLARAQSEGEFGAYSRALSGRSSAVGSAAGAGVSAILGDGGPAMEPSRGDGIGGSGAAAPAPRVWRPAGASSARPPPLPDVPVAMRLSRTAGEALGPPGASCEARAEARQARRQEELGLFGRQGVLRELCALQEQHWEPPAEVPPAAPRGVVGAPSNSDQRAAERQAARDARNRLLLEERAERLAARTASERSERADGLARMGLERGTAGSASAPELSQLRLNLGRQPKDDVEKQKLRVACKMEILDFFKGYSSTVEKMTEGQTKALLAKLHGCTDRTNSAGVVQQCGEQPEQQLHEWEQHAEQVEDDQSIQGRLQQVNDFCNKAFSDPEFDSEFDPEF